MDSKQNQVDLALRGQRIIGAIAVSVALVTTFIVWPYFSIESSRERLPQIYPLVFSSPALDTIEVTHFHIGHGSVDFDIKSKDKCFSLNTAQHFFPYDPASGLELYNPPSPDLYKFYYKAVKQNSAPTSDEGIWVSMDQSRKRVHVYTYHWLW